MLFQSYRISFQTLAEPAALKRGSNNDSLEITWTTIPPTVGRQPKSAVVYGQPGVTGIVKEADDWLKC